MACREALSLAEDLQVLHIQVASDCKVVIDDIHQGTLGKYGAIVAEIHGKATGTPECRFVYESRRNNFEAHNLARFASSLEASRHVWLGLPQST